MMVVCVVVLLAGLGQRASATGQQVSVRVSDVRYKDPRVRALLRLARCETGYLAGGRPNWRHHNSVYSGGLGFYRPTWSTYKQRVWPVPKAREAKDATVRQQLAVGLVLIETFHGYSSWPTCSRRLGLR